MLSVGTLVDGRYRVERLLGRGGMSRVYLATDVRTGHLWALKELRGDGASGGRVADEAAETELRLLKKLRHPMLPAVGDVLVWEGRLLLVLDYIEGRTLAEVLEEGRPAPGEALRWGIALCDVLEYLHGQDPPVIYRDLKPSNVILREDGSLCLIDLGSAAEQGPAGGAGDSLGTVGYAAPEQFAPGAAVDGRADLYSLGVLLRDALGEDAGKGRGRQTADLPAAVWRTLERACMAAPEERFQTAAAMREALERCRKRQGLALKKRAILILCVLTVLLSAGGAGLSALARAGEAARYEELLYAAARTASREEKLADFQAAASLTGMAGDERVYLALLRACGEDPGVAEEGIPLAERLILANREWLLEEPAVYGEVCLEMGKALWICGEEGFAGPIRAAQWCSDAAAWLPEGEERALAEACAEIGQLFGELGQVPAEEGRYTALYEDLRAILLLAAEENIPQALRERMAKLAVQAEAQYAVRFREDGVTEEELLTLLRQAEDLCQDKAVLDGAEERIREGFPEEKEE